VVQFEDSGREVWLERAVVVGQAWKRVLSHGQSLRLERCTRSSMLPTRTGLPRRRRCERVTRPTPTEEPITQKPTRVGLLAPMTHELAPLVAMLGLEPRSDDPYTLHDATVGGVEFVATMTGIGMTAATEATHRILDDGPVDYVIVVGIAGGIEPGL